MRLKFLLGGIALVLAVPAIAQFNPAPGYYATPGVFTPVGGQTIHYTAYRINENGTTTFYLVGGGVFTYVRPMPSLTPPPPR